MIKKLKSHSQNNYYNQLVPTKEFLPVNRVSFRDLTNLTNIVSEHNKKILAKDKILRKNRRKRKLAKSHSFYFNRFPLAVDGYSASLQHTNRLFNDKFGFKNRKVPSHVPILIDKDIMEELQLAFAKEFLETVKNRIRSGKDIQFSFSYYYFIMSKTVEKTIDEIYEDFDTDKSR